MTVPSSAERNDYIGNGSTATYAYGFRITNDSHLLVTVADSDGAETTLTKTTDYTVTGVGVKTGGNIVLVDDGQDWIDDDGYLATGWDMTVRHYVPLAQAYDIRNLGAYYPETNEDAIDYLMWVCKQQQDEIDRSVKAGETVTGVTPVFPAPVDGESLVWSGTSGQMVNSNLKGEKGDTGDTGPTGPAGADGVITALASQAEAEAGSENTKGMTPLRTAQAIAKQAGIPAQTEAVIAAGDSIVFSDVNDGGALKRDTVQGLLDLVGFVDRGDPSAVDFAKAALTVDSSPHDLDLSSIVPAGAKAVLLRIEISHNTLGTLLYMYEKGNSNTINSFRHNASATTYGYNVDGVVSINTNRVLTYVVQNEGTWAILNITVRGWWL